ncbi:MAG: hypothetical protein J1E99_06895 [Muribaculaceae bacterium]|nr:hypothetical protein [Muribaculaceae bacterium]
MKKNFKLGAIGALSLMMLAGCGKKLGEFKADYFSVNPNPLELVGDNVPATVTANIPAKFFVKNAQVTVTPYLVFDGQEVASQPYSFQGQDVRGNNPVVYFDRGGTLTIPVDYQWQPQMVKSNLELAFKVNQGGKTYELPRVQVATGVVATADMVSVGNVTPALAADKFQRIIKEKYAADIMFLINRYNIRKNQLTSEQMVDLQQNITAANAAPNKEISEINIKSYASPDGGLAFNTQLAENREKVTIDYVNKNLAKNISFGELTAQFTPEDWEGFKKLVEASNIQDKALILSVLTMYNDPEERERELRYLASAFDELADVILPELRYSRITATVDVIGKSDEEIMAAFKSNPSSLTVDEILYCATLTDDNGEKIAIYQQAATLYPNDYRTFNDLGMVQFIAGDYAGAKSSFEKAARVNPSAPEAQMNLGLLSLQNKDYSAANQKFGAVAGVEELDEALGTAYLMQGDNAAAARAFGNARTNNAALAQILTKDYAKAKSTLGAIANPDATTYYLCAVLAARENNASGVQSNLSKAVKLDPSMAQRAQNDLEFSKYNVSNIK